MGNGQWARLVIDRTHAPLTSAVVGERTHNRNMKAVQRVLHLPSPAVFGTAPSLAAMQSMNKLTTSKTLYRGATFWYYFRVYLPYVFPLLFLLCMILSLTVFQTVEGNLVLGSMLSLSMSVAVIVSYVMIIPWRKHPSSLVLYRAITSVLFSFNLILEAMSTNDSSCRSYAVVTHFSLLAGECWLTTIALDLVYSVTNPFISYQANIKKYQILVWTFTTFICFVFYFDTSCQGQFDQGMCWVKFSDAHSPCLWGYFLFWMVCMYAYQLYASIYAYLRLRKGLPLTFEVRKKCAMETFKILSIYASYMSLLMFMFSILSSDPDPRPGSNMSNFSLFFLFMISNKGSVDGIVWFMLHDFERATALTTTQSVSYATLKTDENSFLDDTHESNKEKDATHDIIHEVGDEIKKNLTNTIAELADLAIADIDEADLSPQVNMALRQQIVQYVTMGVKNAVTRRDIDIKPPPDWLGFLSSGDPGIVPGLQVEEFLLDGEYKFKAFAPDLFRKLRLLEGIEDTKFLHVLSASANERLSEGASGAFMFFCGGGEYIVKTIRAREARVLHEHLLTYSNYIKKNPDSLLCRFLGSYSLEMFSQTFYFVVMLNCFDPHAYINERFDIKGSWVGRSAEPSKKTKKVVCRNCNEYFIPAQQEQCKAVVGLHEANVVLKDNDLRSKISLSPQEAVRLQNILTKDSDLLGKMGVLDYSLLIGVKKWKFEVKISEEMEMFKPNNAKQSSGVQYQHNGPNSTFRAHIVTGPAIYHFGVIDFLQNWTFQKKIERMFKIYFLRKDPDGLSVMHPLAYKTRFQGKVSQIIDLEGSSGGIGGADAPARIQQTVVDLSPSSPDDIELTSVTVNA